MTATQREKSRESTATSLFLDLCAYLTHCSLGDARNYTVPELNVPKKNQLERVSCGHLRPECGDPEESCRQHHCAECAPSSTYRHNIKGERAALKRATKEVGGGESGERHQNRSVAPVCVCLLLQDLLQNCARGGGGSWRTCSMRYDAGIQRGTACKRLRRAL